MGRIRTALFIAWTALLLAATLGCLATEERLVKDLEERYQAAKHDLPNTDKCDGNAQIYRDYVNEMEYQEDRFIKLVHERNRQFEVSQVPEQYRQEWRERVSEQYREYIAARTDALQRDAGWSDEDRPYCANRLAMTADPNACREFDPRSQSLLADRQAIHRLDLARYEYCRDVSLGYLGVAQEAHQR